MRSGAVALLTAGALALSGGVVQAGGSATTPAQPADLLVQFEPGAARHRAAASVDGRIVERLALPGLVRIRLDRGANASAAAEALERRGDVAYADPNRRYTLFATPDDPGFPDLWGLDQLNDADIDAPEAWNVTTGSSAVTVAVVDTGIDWAHPDLAANIWTNAGETSNGADDDGNGLVDDVRGWDFYGTGSPGSQDNNPTDGHGHGTHVAGTIGAKGNNTAGVVGVNWNVKLMPLRVGVSGGLSEAAIVNAFQYACAMGARVVNGSFGATGPGSFSPSIHQAIASCPNTLFVFSAGNSALDNDLTSVNPCNDSSPNVICVAATTDADQRAGFSNFGAVNVDLAAPGQDVLSTWPTTVSPFDYAYSDGTSMAAPHVAGAAALVRSHRPELTVDELRRALLLSADKLPSLAGLVATGGRLNVHRALGQELLPPVGLTASSPSHGGGWTNRPTVDLVWGGATDASGIDGFSYAFSPVPDFVPDEIKDIEETVTAFSVPMGDGEHWFHVRARDNSGNWGAAAHVGPIRIDTFQPVRPVPSSPSHRVGGASTDRTVAVAWAGATDSSSGIDGYSFSWTQGRAGQPDETKDSEEDVMRTTSPRLAVGAWWFNLRARDNAGNWSDSVSLGPFSIRGEAPSCIVPRLRGLTLRSAGLLLSKRGCALGKVTRVRSARVRRGRVVAQLRAPGLRLPRGARVAVAVSRGRR